MADRDEGRRIEEERAERREILDRLNSYDAGLHEDDLGEARRLEARREAERQVALGYGRHCLGTL